MICFSKNAAAPQTASSADTLNEIAVRVQRLGPDRRDPERYHVEKSEIVADLRKLARKIGTGR